MTEDIRRTEYIRLIARVEVLLGRVDEQLMWAQSRALDRHKIAEIVTLRNEVHARQREIKQLFPVDAPATPLELTLKELFDR